MSGRAWVLVAALVLPACGGGDDDSSGSSDEGGLSSVFKKFIGGSGAGGAADGGTAAVPPGGGGTLSAQDCQGLCAKVVGCVGEACPNYLRIPEDLRGNGESDCRSSCGGTPISAAELQQFNAASCQQVYQLVSADSPDFTSFCAQQPVSDPECAQFCRLFAGCLEAAGQPQLQAGQCELTCIWGDAVRCVMQNGSCGGFEQCQRLFPSGD